MTVNYHAFSNLNEVNFQRKVYALFIADYTWQNSSDFALYNFNYTVYRCTARAAVDMAMVVG